MIALDKDTIVRQIETLPPLSQAVQRILAVTESSESNADDVAEALSMDQALAAQLLRIANSPLYGVGRQVRKISRAVVLLGSLTVRNMVVGFATRNGLLPEGRAIPEHLLMWRHSMAIAAGSELIARQCKIHPPEEAFVTGLLLNTGWLVFASVDSDRFRRVIQEASEGGSMIELERRYFGIDHAETGYLLLNHWGLPDRICNLVRHHHDTSLDSSDELAPWVAITQVAIDLTRRLGFGFDLAAGGRMDVSASIDLLRLSGAEQVRIMNELRQKADDAIAAFDQGSAAPRKTASCAAQRSVVWVTLDKTDGSDMGQLVLEHFGCHVERATAENMADHLEEAQMAVLDVTDPFGDQFDQTIEALSTAGCRRILVLYDPSKDTDMRECDQETGVCLVPRPLTAFDLMWAESRMAA